MGGDSPTHHSGDGDSGGDSPIHHSGVDSHAASATSLSPPLQDSSSANDSSKSLDDAMAFCHYVATSASLPLPTAGVDSSSTMQPSLPRHDSCPMVCPGPDVSALPLRGLTGLAQSRMNYLYSACSGSSELEGPRDAKWFQKSSSEHNRQSGGYGSRFHNVNVLPRHHPQHRGNRHWNVHRGFDGRNMHMPPRGVPRFTRPWLPPPPPPPPPPSSYQYPFSQYLQSLTPPPYGGPYWGPGFGPRFPYYAAPPPQPPSPVPYMPPMTNVQAAPDSELSVKIVRQIEYYFSSKNLVTDDYLRRHMDKHQGWVPVRLVAGFPRMKKLTNDIQIILDALQTSTSVEILGDKIRPRYGWQIWIM